LFLIIEQTICSRTSGLLDLGWIGNALGARPAVAGRRHSFGIRERCVI
jgi:hypothetical protein